MTTTVPTRLAPEIFRLPVQRLRDGYYSDAYFVLTRQLLQDEGEHPHVTMQVFQKQDSVLGGIDEAIAVLKTCAGTYDPDGEWVSGWDQLVVEALHEGDRIAPHETVMTIEGDYSLFAHLETVYLGSLARRSLIMRNVREVVEAARGKEIFYFPARHDHWLVQTGDGWSAHVAGAIGVSTDAQASWWGGRGIGTVPHGLIAAYGGDTVRAATLFADRFHAEMNVTVLVDFVNDSVGTALEVASALGPKLWGVRLDTSEQLVDRSLFDEMGGFTPDRRQSPVGREGPRSVGRRRVRRGQDRGVGWIHGAANPRVRSVGRARRRLRRRLVVDPRQQRLHGGRRAAGRAPLREGGPVVFAQSAVTTCDVRGRKPPCWLL